MSEKNRSIITKTELCRKFPWMTDHLIETYLPKIQIPGVKDRKHMSAWDRKKVLEIIRTDENLKEERKQIRLATQRNLDLRLEYQSFVSRFTPYEKFHYAEKLDRNFILHIGPTNSGKTYRALEALKNAGSGVYLGPLRLMALEVFDKLNDAGIPCSLLTGEENISVPCADFTASTVEMAEYERRYDAAVIDEAQMISDPRRGSHWFDAVCRINAKTVHICLAPEAENLMVGLMEAFDAPYEIVYHKRLTPLSVTRQLTGLADILPGDAIIAFSREKVLGIAAAMKVRGFEPAIIYGGLPPRSRRIEVEDYISGRKNIIVATDAIGMGLSLPIRRIVFSEIKKFDGFRKRMLTSSEIKQIAGRAGRFGIFDRGEVTSFHGIKYIADALQQDSAAIEKVRISFPGNEAVESPYPLQELLVEWQRLPRDDWYDRENMEDAQKLLRIFPGKLKTIDKETIYRLITCPIDMERKYMTDYWVKCTEAVLADKDIPVPNFGLNSLQTCEQQYKALDLYKIMCARFNRENHCENFQEEVIRRISILLQSSKSRFQIKTPVPEQQPAA